MTLVQQLQYLLPHQGNISGDEGIAAGGDMQV